MKEQPTNHTGGPLLEQRFRQYLSAFDGKKKDFSEVEHLFDALSHKDFYETTNNSQQQQTVSREQTKAIHSMYFAMGTSATLIHYRRISLHTIDISYHLFNDQLDIVVRQLSSRMQNSIVGRSRCPVGKLHWTTMANNRLRLMRQNVQPYHI
mmetsp:Transcript_20116/g.30980  ORF Transcript_20116/g.30980 Transcript_20116/m.30980 type:complete len:152 (-) Transcript_20116:15-470(-)